MCILWREKVATPLKVLALRTVTYGLACAPFPVLCTLQQLAQDESLYFPAVAEVIKNNIFVDVAAGVDSVRIV